MAHYNIDSLNYMAIGRGRVLVNMDVSHYDVSCHTYIVRTENHPGVLAEPNMAGADAGAAVAAQLSSGDADRAMLRAMLSTSTEQYRAAADAFNAASATPNKTFVLDDLPIRLAGGRNTAAETGHDRNMYSLPSQDSADRWIFPMYQIEDVCVKQDSQHKQANPTVFGGDRYFDVYSAGMDSDPVGFCQTSQGSFVLTQPTAQAPSQLQTNFGGERAKAYDTAYYEYQISSGLVPTYLYGTSAEQQALMAAGAPAEQLFEPSANMTGIEYSYVLEMDHSRQTQYDSGDVPGQIYITKNMYDPVYSMDMAGRTSIRGCRQYVGIGSGRGDLSKQQPYLKFMDCLSYSGRQSGGLDADMSQSRDKYTYQKVEYVYPTKFTGNAKHKSTLFSVSIGGSQILSTESQFRYQLETATAADTRKKAQERLDAVERIKRDIKSAVREIARNVAPANTQLFDTYFEEG